MTRTIYAYCIALALCFSGAVSEGVGVDIVYPAKGNMRLGSGVEPLTYDDRLQIIDLGFGDAHVDQDHTGFLPNNVIEYNNPDVKEDFYATVKTWNSNQTQQDDFHCDSKASLYGVSGSFSEDRQWLHSHQSNTNTRVAEVKAKVLTTSVTLQIEDVNFTKGFNRSIERIAASLAHNTNASITRAIWEADMLLKDYGSSLIYKYDKGGQIHMKVAININDWTDYTESKLKSSAAVDFSSKIFSMSGHVTGSHDKTSYQSYNDSMSDYYVSAKGGLPLKEGQKFNDWIQTVPGNEAIINTYTMSILDIITPWTLPQISPYDLQTSRDLIDSRILVHIENNQHRGCMDPTSSNYDYKANIHNQEACRYNRKFAFGGVYQHATCDKFSKKNDLTQGFTCPPGFQDYPIFQNYTINHDWTSKEKDCHSCWVVGTCCHSTTDNHHESCIVSPHICIALLTNESAHGASFGGMYTNNHVNDVTKNNGCPHGFESQKLSFSWDESSYLTVCYSPFDTPQSDGGVGFGGAFSSSMVNPESKHYYCPLGFERHALILPGGKSVYYCIDMDDMEAEQTYFPPGYGGSEPPFIDGFKIAEGDNEYLMLNVLSHVSFETQLRMMKNSGNAYEQSLSGSNGGDSSTMTTISPGGIVGIVIATLIVAMMMVLVAKRILHSRTQQRNGYTTLEA
jgi:hypothetical protein